MEYIKYVKPVHSIDDGFTEEASLRADYICKNEDSASKFKISYQCSEQNKG
jgi:hypothetical protein